VTGPARRGGQAVRGPSWRGAWQAVRAEWTKARTVAATGGLALAVAAVTAGVSLVAVLAVRCPPGGCTGDPVKVSLTGVQVGQLVVVVLAVLAIGGEYSTGTIQATLAALPRRTGVLAAKAAVLAGLVLAAGTAGVLGSLLAGRLLLAGRGYPPLVPSSAPVLRAAGGSVLYLVLIGLLTLGVATVVRHSAAAVGLVLGLLYLAPIAASAVTDPHWQRHIEQIAPMSAGLAVQATTGVSALPIGPWAGLGVLTGWAAGALLAGGLALRLRDT
jgi:ABC-2 type transport system permease protein